MSGSAASAYDWVRQETAQLPSVPDIESNAEHGIDAGLDDAIKSFLDKVGLLDELEKVTGMPTQLTDAAHEWTAQGNAMLAVADGLRSAASGLPTAWEGDSSEAFGHGMGQIVEAIEGTGQEMGRTASILSRAAEECKLAEDTIIGIIREAIEWAAMTLAAMVVTDILTLGLATLVDGLVAEGEVAVFLARVERVSAKLAETLRDLMKAVKEMKQGTKSFNEARKAAAVLRKTGGMKAIGQSDFKDWMAHHVVTSQIKGHGSVPLIGAATGLTGEPLAPVKEGAKLLEDSFDRDGKPAAPAPYRVDRRSIEEDFG